MKLNLPRTYLFLLPFTKVFYHSLTGYSIQALEILFALSTLVLHGSTKWRELIYRREYDILDAGVLALILSQWIASWIQARWWGSTSIWGLTYLGIMYHVFRGIAAHNRAGAAKHLARDILVFGGILCATVVGSWLYAVWHPTGSLELWERKYIAGIGNLRRIEALTMSPNMLMNMLMLPLLVAISGWWHYRKRVWGIAAAGLLVCALTTVSKSLMLFPAGIIGLVLLLKPLHLWQTVIGGSIVIATVLFFVLYTKVAVVPHASPWQATLLDQDYMSKDTLKITESYTIMATMHYRMNREAWEAFCSAPIAGIGLGRFTQWIDTRKAAGLYPENKLSYAPHSLYLGLLAQSGLVGFAGLSFFLYTLMSSGVKIWQRTPIDGRWLVAALCVFLTIWCIGSLSMDTLHFRQFWWVVAILSSWSSFSAASASTARG